MNIKFTAITGFKDILPDSVSRYQLIESVCRETFHKAGYREIRTPLVERTEVFKKSIGEATDIVEKEMYTFTDKSGDSLTIRPEGTASVVRAYIEHNIGMKEQIFKTYYMGPMFRHERPQKGRLRQFHQIGAEIFNVAAPTAEVELILLLNSILKKLRVNGLKLQVNSVGCSLCRPAFIKKLSEFLKSSVSKLCDNCKNRIERNPMRTLDCKNESCRTILNRSPKISDDLCNDCKIHFNEFRSYLEQLKIEYMFNPWLVRGLDYYTRTAFELVTGEEGAQNAVAAGGRYDNLVELFGGDPTPAVGFAIGVERLVTLINPEVDLNIPLSLFIATVGKDAFGFAIKLATLLREKGIRVETGYGDRSLKSQMRLADKLKAKYVLIIGEDEIKTNMAVIKNMNTSQQVKIKIDSPETIQSILERNCG